VLQCGYAESKRNVLRQILNVLTDGAVRQFSGREFQSLEATTEKQRAAVSKLCGGTDRSFGGIQRYEPNCNNFAMLKNPAKRCWIRGRWLPTCHQFFFVQTHLWKNLHEEYISDLLTSVANIPGRSTLRASSCGNLVVPRTRRRIGDRAFSVRREHGTGYRRS